MSQPMIFPPDNKTPSPPPPSTTSAPTYATFAQPPQTLPPGAQSPFVSNVNATGIPPQPQQPPYGAQPPAFGAQPPLVNVSPQNTGFATLPGQQMPFGTMPGQQQVPRGTIPGQVPLGTMPGQQIPFGAQSLGAQGSVPMPGAQSFGAQGPGAIPQQPISGMGTLPQQPISPMHTGAYVVPQPALMTPGGMGMQAQLGAQYQATQMAQCAMGNHARQTKHGIAGIIGAILFFPIGLVCLFIDKEEVCMRCGQRLG